jgi:hypothetical protein
MRRRWGLARQNDGKLLLITNAQDLSLQEVIDRSTSLADIERGFAIGQNLGWGDMTGLSRTSADNCRTASALGKA